MSFADDTTMYMSSHSMQQLFQDANTYSNDLYKWFCAKQTIIKAFSHKTTPVMNTRRCDPLRGPYSSSCGGLWPLAEAFFCP